MCVCVCVCVSVWAERDLTGESGTVHVVRVISCALVMKNEFEMEQTA